jgi:hypothetical protein
MGIVGMALAGFLHVGANSHGTHWGHVKVGHGGHVGHGHGAKAGATHHGAHGHAGSRFSVRQLLSLSPLDVFSFCAGAGLAAFLFRPYLAKPWLPIPAVIGALLFDIFVTRMIMNTITNFAAAPSSGLEGTVATEGLAMTTFDRNGKGLVKLTLDGQIVQLLATLEPVERNAGVQVRKGDTLLIVEVDSAKNCCMVTREFSQEEPEHQVLRLEGKS